MLKCNQFTDNYCTIQSNTIQCNNDSRVGPNIWFIWGWHRDILWQLGGCCCKNTQKRLRYHNWWLEGKVERENKSWECAMRSYGYGKIDESGERLLGFTAVHSLFICNTRFQQKSNPKWTWELLNDVQKNMTDLVIIHKRWKTSVINCRISQGAGLSSDHSLVLCNIIN